MSRRSRVLWVGAALAFVVTALTAGFVTRDRDFYGPIPQPPPLESTTVIEMEPGVPVCMDEITLTPESQVAHFRIGTRRKDGVPLRVAVTGAGGYRQVREISASSFQDNDVLDVPIDAPARAMFGRLCITSGGSRRVDLYATTDRTISQLQTTVDGEPVRPNPWLWFTEARPGSLADHAGRIAERMSTFRPGFIGPWLLWPLLAALLTGVPALAIYAVWRADRDDGARS